jgi:hypothetical protein
MTRETLWTVIIDRETGHPVDAYDQSHGVCGGGPNTCGGCRDCIVQQCGDDFDVRYDVTTTDMKAMADL